MSVNNTESSFLRYAGGPTARIAKLTNKSVMATPAERDAADELADVQRNALKSVAPDLHRVLDENLTATLEARREVSRKTLKRYALAAGRVNRDGKPMIRDDVMVAPRYLVPSGTGTQLVSYEASRPPHYSDVESVREIVSESLKPGQFEDVVSTLESCFVGRRSLPVPIELSMSTGANVLPVLHSNGEVPVAVLAPRSNASSFAGTFGTFGGAVVAGDIGPDGSVLVIGAAGKGSMSAAARELYEESGRGLELRYDDLLMVAQADLQVSYGAVEVISGLTLRDLARSTEYASDKAEFTTINGSRVIGVPLTLDHLSAFMCQPTGVDEITFEARMPPWSTALLLAGAERYLRGKDFQELTERIADIGSMKQAYHAVSADVRNEITAMTSNQGLTLVR